MTESPEHDVSVRYEMGHFGYYQIHDFCCDNILETAFIYFHFFLPSQLFLMHFNLWTESKKKKRGLEIYGQVNNEDYEQESPTRIETQNTENQNTIDPSITKQMVTENKINVGLIKKKEYTIINQEPRLDDGNCKVIQIIDEYPNWPHHWTNKK